MVLPTPTIRQISLMPRVRSRILVRRTDVVHAFWVSANEAREEARTGAGIAHQQAHFRALAAAEVTIIALGRCYRMVRTLVEKYHPGLMTTGTEQDIRDLATTLDAAAVIVGDERLRGFTQLHLSTFPGVGHHDQPCRNASAGQRTLKIYGLTVSIPTDDTYNSTHQGMGPAVELMSGSRAISSRRRSARTVVSHSRLCVNCSHWLRTGLWHLEGTMPRRYRRRSSRSRGEMSIFQMCTGAGALMGFLVWSVGTGDNLVPLLLFTALGVVAGVVIERAVKPRRAKSVRQSSYVQQSQARSPRAQKIQDQKDGVLTGEDLVQRNILDWLEEDRPDIFVAHIPNGGHTSWRAAHLLRIGMVKGMPDLILINGQGEVGFMEVKTDTGSISMDQHDVKHQLTGRGLPHAFVRSVRDCSQTLAVWGW